MANLKLIHNNNAGDEDHSKDKLISLIESLGYACDYASMDSNGWDKISADTDLILVAGGDGTVKKIVAEMLKRTLLCKKIPLALLPLGTANNLSKTLGEVKDSEFPKYLTDGKLKKFDVAQVSGIRESSFFIEGLGFGVFPELIQKMKKVDSKLSDQPEERIAYAVELLSKIVSGYSASHCQVIVDEVDYSGNYLLVEIMNIKSIGPNLSLAPDADPGDGYFEVVLLAENERIEFLNYLKGLINGVDKFEGKVIRGKNICLKWNGTAVHVDDKLVKLKPDTAVKVEVREGILDFLTID